MGSEASDSSQTSELQNQSLSVIAIISTKQDILDILPLQSRMFQQQYKYMSVIIRIYLKCIALHYLLLWPISVSSLIGKVKVSNTSLAAGHFSLWTVTCETSFNSSKNVFPVGTLKWPILWYCWWKVVPPHCDMAHMISWKNSTFL